MAMIPDDIPPVLSRGRPAFTAIQRQKRLEYRFVHGKKCAFCGYRKDFYAFSRDPRSADNSDSRCKACRRMVRTMIKTGHRYLLVTVRQALRVASTKEYHDTDGHPPVRLS